MDQEYILPIPVEEDNSDLVPKGKSPYYGSLKQITNCLLINSDLDHAYNDAGIVTSSSEYAPSDLVTGIREVFVISSSIPHIAVKIHGISTSNQYKEWVRYYNGSTWTDWFGFATTDQIDSLNANINTVDAKIPTIENIAGSITPVSGLTIYDARKYGRVITLLLGTPAVTNANVAISLGTISDHRPFSGSQAVGNLSPATNGDFGYGNIYVDYLGNIRMYYSKTTTYGLYGSITYIE